MTCNLEKKESVYDGYYIRSRSHLLLLFHGAHHIAAGFHFSDGLVRTRVHEILSGNWTDS